MYEETTFSISYYLLQDPDVPIVIVANKSDLETDTNLPYDSLEATSIFDLEHGYVECSAKEKLNIAKIFKELLIQGKPRFDLCLPICKGEEVLSSGSAPEESGSFTLYRRQSLPLVPVGQAFQATNLPYKIDEEGQDGKTQAQKEKRTQRRSSIAALRRDSCKVS